MPFLLIVFLSLVCLPNVGTDWPQPPGMNKPWQAVLVTWSLVALQVGWAWIVTRSTCRALARANADNDRPLRRYERWRWRHQLGLFGVYALAMTLGGWG